MTLRPPTAGELRDAAARLGMTLGAEELRAFTEMAARFADGFRAIDSMPQPRPPVKYSRDPGWRPRPEQNPLNAWYYRTAIRGASGGPLRGKTVALKDNIMLAGVPLMNGTSLLEGFVPDFDATVVTRVLDAGGEIAGKAHCEALCLSAASHTNATGPVHNPRRRGYSAGGSSSGCAALVAAAEVDMAIGCDQGGSIRVPASFCGAYGMKPTHGLVPYTGILAMEATIDHAGPITGSVRDNAMLLEVLAGADGYDPRQAAPRKQPYTALLEGGVAGMRIGVVREGFGTPLSEPEVDGKVRDAARRLADLGASVEEVSIPMHAAAGAVSAPIVLDGVLQTTLLGYGTGTGREDLYPTELIAFLRNWRLRADELPATIKFAASIGMYLRSTSGPLLYAKAMNLCRVLRAAYDQALARCDLLLMPTAPMKATPLPGPDAPVEEVLARAFEPTANTQPFNNTHHPAMSVPCGTSDGLPVGMMLIGRHFDEPAIYRAACAFEQAADWTAL